MKTKLLGALAGSILLAGGVAVAQQPAPPAATPAPAAPATPAPATPAPAQPAAPAPAAAAKVAIPPAFVRAQVPGQTLARDRLIGAAVHNREGVIIGDIEDLILSQANQVVGVIMGVGGVLGLGEKKVGVQYGSLQFTQKDGKLHIVLPAATKEVLAAVPAYTRLEPKKGFVERAKEKSKEVYDRAKEQAGPAYEKAKEAAGKAYEKAKDAAGHAVDKAKEAVKGQPAGTPAPADKK